MPSRLRIRRPKDGGAPGMPKAPSARRVDREGPIHREIVDWLRMRFPEGVTHHSANSIGLSGRQIMLQIARNEAMGTVKGFPDLICLLPGPKVLLFEVKAPGNYQDADQRALHHRMQALGCRVAVVRSVADVEAKLSEWGVEDAQKPEPEQGGHL